MNKTEEDSWQSKIFVDLRKKNRFGVMLLAGNK